MARVTTVAWPRAWRSLKTSEGRAPEKLVHAHLVRGELSFGARTATRSQAGVTFVMILRVRVEGTRLR
jgi:hypothetical protein